MRHPDVVIIMTDEERNAPTYEGDDLKAWREEALPARHWFKQNGVSFERHYSELTRQQPQLRTALTEMMRSPGSICRSGPANQEIPPSAVFQLEK